MHVHDGLRDSRREVAGSPRRCQTGVVNLPMVPKPPSIDANQKNEMKTNYKIVMGELELGALVIRYEVNPPDPQCGDLYGYIQVTQVWVGDLDIYDDIDCIPGAIEYLERQVTDARR